MALLFMDSFDNYSTMTIAALGKWQTYSAPGASALTIAAGGRHTSSCLKLTHGAGSGPIAYLQGVLGSALGRSIVGFAIDVTTFDATQETPFFTWVDIATMQVTVSFLPNGQLRFHSAGRGGTTLSTSSASVITATATYFYLEIDMTINSATGAIVVHSNGVNVPLSASSGLNTAPSGNNTFNTFQLGLTGGSSGGGNVSDYQMDDFYMLSTSGGSNTTFLGDVRVDCLFPTSAGSSTAFTPNGAATNWQCVNEASEDGDTTYVSDANAGDIDTYNHGATPTNTGTIFGIQQCAVWRKDDAGARTVGNQIKSGATSATGATVSPTQTYAWGLDILETNPNTSAAWTKATIDAAEIGVKVIS